MKLGKLICTIGNIFIDFDIWVGKARCVKFEYNKIQYHHWVFVYKNTIINLTWTKELGEY